MVSSTLNMSTEELVEELERFRREYAEDAEYQEVRGELPAEWPL